MPFHNKLEVGNHFKWVGETPSIWEIIKIDLIEQKLHIKDIKTKETNSEYYFIWMKSPEWKYVGNNSKIAIILYG